MACAAFLGLVLFAFVSNAEAFQIKRVLRGSTSFAIADNFLEIDLGPQLVDAGDGLDTTKSLVLVRRYLTQTGTPDKEIVMVELGDPRTLYASRYNSGSQMTVYWEVIEFGDGVVVNSGRTTFGKTTCSKTINFGFSYTVGKTLPFLQTKATKAMNSNEDHQLYVAAEILTSNSASFVRGDCGASGAPVEVLYQLVEFTNDVTVKQGVTNIPQNSGCATPIAATVSPAITNTAKAFLHQYTSVTANNNGYQSAYQIRGVISNASTLNFDRIECSNGKNGAVDVYWYIAELTD